MRPPAVRVVGKATAEIALASAALCRAGARVVASRPDLAIVVDAKTKPRRRRAKRVPLIAIVPRRHKPGVLAAGVDAAYSRPLGWRAYRRLVERILVEWKRRPSDKRAPGSSSASAPSASRCRAAAR